VGHRCEYELLTFILAPTAPTSIRLIGGLLNTMAKCLSRLKKIIIIFSHCLPVINLYSSAHQYQYQSPPTSISLCLPVSVFAHQYQFPPTSISISFHPPVSVSASAHQYPYQSPPTSISLRPPVSVPPTSTSSSLPPPVSVLHAFLAPSDYKTPK